MVNAWKVIQQNVVNNRETVGEYETMDITSSGGVCDMLRPSSYVSLLSEVQGRRRRLD